MDNQLVDRGLSNTNKVLMFNKQTRTYLLLDPKQARISRMRKRVFAWANAIKSDLSDRRYRKVMITLTYAKVDDWKPNHIRNYVKNLKARLGDRLRALAWCAELQERGAVHYHIELIVVKGTRIPYPDKSKMWPYGMSQVQTAKTVFYICKYMGKEHQKTGVFPKHLRMFAVYIAKCVITDLARWYFKLSVCPNWLREYVLNECKVMSIVKRIKKLGWIVNEVRVKSPYVFIQSNFKIGTCNLESLSV